MKTDDLENIHNFMLKNCVYLDLCTIHGSNLVPGKTLDVLDMIVRSFGLTVRSFGVYLAVNVFN